MPLGFLLGFEVISNQSISFSLLPQTLAICLVFSSLPLWFADIQHIFWVSPLISVDSELRVPNAKVYHHMGFQFSCLSEPAMHIYSLKR